MDTPTSDDVERLRRIAAILDLMPVTDPRNDKERRRIVRTVAGYLVPRIDQIDEPLLVTVGGGDGAGKSHVVNAVFGDDLVTEGAIRPTTMIPTLVGAVGSDGTTMPPLLRRVQASASGVETVSVAGRLAESVGLVDLPGSVDETSVRRIQNLADLAIVVVTPSRYADASVWRLIEELYHRAIPVWVVLNRYRPGDEEVADDLRSRLAQVAADIRVFTVEETTDGRSPDRAAELVSHLMTVAGNGREDFLSPVLRRRTTQVINRTAALTFPLDDVRRSGERLRQIAEAEYAAEAESVRSLVAQDGLGAGAADAEWFEVADRLAGVVTRRVGSAAERTALAWQATRDGAELLRAGGHDLWRHPPDTAAIARDRLLEWERRLGALVAGHTRRPLKAAKLAPVVAAAKARALGDATRPRWRIRRRLRDDIEVVAAEARDQLADTAADIVLDDLDRFVRRLGARPAAESLDELRSLVAEIGSAPVTASSESTPGPAQPDAAVEPDSSAPETEESLGAEAVTDA
jgi:hypothetical protein